MLSNPDAQPNAAAGFPPSSLDFKLVHVPADKHKGPGRLPRHEPAPGKEDDNSEGWVHNTLSLGARQGVVSWLDAFPTDAHHTDALVLSLEANDDDDKDFVQHNCSRRPPG